MEKKSPDAGLMNEGSLNTVGYQLIQAGDAPNAVSLMSWVAGRYPKSANAQDSLADAYYAAKNKEGARAAVERSIALAKTDPALSGEARDKFVQGEQEKLKKLQ